MLRLFRSTALALLAGERLTEWLCARAFPPEDTVLYSFWGTDCAMSIVGLEEKSRKNCGPIARL